MTHEPSLDPLLLDRYLAGDLPPADRARVDAWLRAHPRDAQLVREAPALVLGVARTADTTAAWQTLSARLQAATPQDDLAARRERARGVVPRGWLRRVGAVAATLLVTVGGYATWRATRGGSIDAPRGRDVTAMLPDGTRITLAAGSRVRWAASFGAATREVTLEGQGYFDVVHDTRRPFRVRARDAVAQDVGTRFVVRAWPELASVDVAVEEGIVALADTLHATAAAATLLRAGQRGTLVRGGVQVSADADVTLAWMRGALVFDDRPLSEVLPAIGRRFDVTLVADPALTNRRLTARFGTQSLPDVLDALAVTLGVRVDTRGRTISLTPLTP